MLGIICQNVILVYEQLNYFYCVKFHLSSESSQSTLNSYSKFRTSCHANMAAHAINGK